MAGSYFGGRQLLIYPVQPLQCSCSCARRAHGNKSSTSRLEIEITESTLLQDTAKTRNDLHQLERLGVKISLDDFGTAYSSLSYLHSFPFNKVKIDQSFLRGLVDDTRKVSLLRGMTRLECATGTPRRGRRRRDRRTVRIAPQRRQYRRSSRVLALQAHALRGRYVSCFTRLTFRLPRHPCGRRRFNKVRRKIKVLPHSGTRRKFTLIHSNDTRDFALLKLTCIHQNECGGGLILLSSGVWLAIPVLGKSS